MLIKCKCSLNINFMKALSTFQQFTVASWGDGFLHQALFKVVRGAPARHSTVFICNETDGCVCTCRYQSPVNKNMLLFKAKENSLYLPRTVWKTKHKCLLVFDFFLNPGMNLKRSTSMSYAPFKKNTTSDLT